jgi:hypothetical protein
MEKIKLKRDPVDLAGALKGYFITRQPTYFLDGAQQCDRGRRRSITDFRSLMKNYFPRTRATTVTKAVNALKSAGLITCSYCSTVRRIVHYPIVHLASIETVRNALKKARVENKVYKK